MKKLIAILLALAVCITFAACGDEESSEPEPVAAKVEITETMGDDGKLTINIASNLPEGTLAEVTLRTEDRAYVAQDTEVTIAADGTATTDPFTYRKQPFEPGEYTIIFKTLLYEDQPEEIQEKIGEDYVNFTGDLVTFEGIRASKTITIE